MAIVTLPRCGRTLTYYVIFDASFGPGNGPVGFVFAGRFGLGVGFVFTCPSVGRVGFVFTCPSVGRVGFVSTRREVRGLEVADRAGPARQRDALVIVDRGEALDAVGRFERGGPQRTPRVTNAHDVDLRGGDGACALVAQCVTPLARNIFHDLARQRRDLGDAGSIAARWHVETAAARVLRRARLAGGGARTGAALRVAAVGRDPRGADWFLCGRFAACHACPAVAEAG